MLSENTNREMAFRGESIQEKIIGYGNDIGMDGGMAQNNLRDCSDNSLMAQIKEAVRTERKITCQILEQLREIDRRMLYAARGYSSLFYFCTKELGYSESAAYRRMSAMRLLRDIPDLKVKLENNKVNLSTLAQMQSFIKRKEKTDSMKMSLEDKKDIISAISNQNQKQCEKILANISPLICQNIERQRVVSNNMTELKMYIDESILNKITRAKEILSNVDGSMSNAELLERLLEEFLRRKDPQYNKVN